MKLLLNENLPRKLKVDIGPGFVTWTVQELGWQGKKNRDLLRSMTNSGFDGMMSIDKNLQYQQNLKFTQTKTYYSGCF